MKIPRTLLRFLVPVAILVVAYVVTRGVIAMRPEAEIKRPEAVVPVVRVALVETETVRVDVLAQGTVVPRTETVLVAEVSGRVESISPSLFNGGFFSKGDPLVYIDPRDNEMRVEEVKLDVARAERRVTQEEADARSARSDWESLGNGGEPTPLVLREPQLAEARAELAAARARLDKAHRDVERCTILAPYTGRIRSESVDPGQYLMAGSEVARVFATDAVEVRLPMPETDFAFLEEDLAFRRGDEAEPGPEVTLYARFGGREGVWKGNIERIESELDPKSRMAVVVVRVADPYGRGETIDRPPLALGTFVRAVIAGRSFDGCMPLPRAAMRGRDSVYVVDEEDRISIRRVEILRAEADRVLVSTGLDLGERVIVSPLDTAVDGMRVKINEGGSE